MKRGFWFWSIALVIVLGCGGSGNNTTVAPDPLVGFVNASTNSTAIDAWVNDAQIGNDVAFRNVSPKAGSVLTFLSFEPGEYDFTVQSSTDVQTQAIETNVIERDKSYLFVAAGLVTPPNTEDPKRLRPVVAEFDRTAPNGGKARIVIVHAYDRAEGLETPSIDFQNPGDNPLFKETAITYAGGRGALIDAGTQTFVAKRNGAEFDITPEVTFTFESGKIYVAIVAGIEGGTGALAPAITFHEVQPK